MEEHYVDGSVMIDGYGPLRIISSEQLYGPGQPALIAATQSQGGKTVTLVDMIYTARERMTGFNLITNSYNTGPNGYLRSMIPEIHVKNWDLHLVTRLWGDCLKVGLRISAGMEDRLLEMFIAHRCPDAPQLRARIEEVNNIMQRNADLFPNVEQGVASRNLHIKLAKMMYIRDHFSLDDPSLSSTELTVVTTCMASKPCYGIFFDDVTAQIQSGTTDMLDIPLVGENNNLTFESMKGKQGWPFLLVNMLTLCRHYATIGAFVHFFGAFDVTIRRQFGALMFLGQDAITEACTQQTLSPDDKHLVAAAYRVASRYKHHKVVLFPNPAVTSHGHHVALFCARVHREPLPIGVPSYQAVVRHVEDTIRRYQQDNVYREEEGRSEKEAAQRLATLVADDAPSSSSSSQSIPTFGAMLAPPSTSQRIPLEDLFQ